MKKIDFKLKVTGKKILFVVAVSMVLAMAIGSFALGENQTLASPSAVESQSEEATNGTGLFNVTGGTEGVNYSYANSVLTIHSGNLTISTTAQTNERIVVDGAATITLKNVNISTDSGAALQIQDNATFNVNILLADGSDNILKTTAENHAGLQKNGSGDSIGTLTIGVLDDSQGTGKLQANGGDSGAGIGGGYQANGSNITITGGEVTANGGYEGAGIGGGDNGSGSNITINGDVVIANGGDYAAGIGGGNFGSGSDITINDGEVTAYGGQNNGAGIGGGDHADGINITITGGVVTATGGLWGAGIGSGAGKDGTRITITGGEVTATGGEWGAGIGGGNYGNVSNIRITGGVVMANGGSYGAGIGGGYFGNGSDVVITDCAVKAYGGNFGAGIGGGYYGNGSDIAITDCVVKSYGGYKASGIGSGDRIYGSNNNSISGDAVVLATSGGVDSTSTMRGALEGFSTITQGIVFTGLGTAFDSTTGRATDLSWDESGTMYDDSVIISQNAEFPTNLTIEDGKKIILESEETLTISAGATLQNEGTLTINGTVTCQYDGEAKTTGKVTTKTYFYREGSTDVYAAGYQTYQTNTGVQKYTNLPNTDDSNDTVFNSWFTKPGGPDGGGTKVNENANVLLNNHNFYEYRSEKHDITITQPEHGTVTIDPENPKTDDEVIITVTPEEGYEIDGLPIVKTEDGRIIEVIPTGNPNEYKFIMPDSNVTIEVNFVLISVRGIKTGDSFAGIATLAILGLATMGTILTRKRR